MQFHRKLAEAKAAAQYAAATKVQSARLAAGMTARNVAFCCQIVHGGGNAVAAAIDAAAAAAAAAEASKALGFVGELGWIKDDAVQSSVVMSTPHNGRRIYGNSDDDDDGHDDDGDERSSPLAKQLAFECVLAAAPLRSTPHCTHSLPSVPPAPVVTLPAKTQCYMRWATITCLSFL